MSNSVWPHGLQPARLLCSMGILQARILEWVAMFSSEGSSQFRDQTHVCIAGWFFTVWAAVVQNIYNHIHLQRKFSFVCGSSYNDLVSRKVFGKKWCCLYKKCPIRNISPSANLNKNTAINISQLLVKGVLIKSKQKPSLCLKRLQYFLAVLSWH